MGEIFHHLSSTIHSPSHHPFNGANTCCRASARRAVAAVTRDQSLGVHWTTEAFEKTVEKMWLKPWENMEKHGKTIEIWVNLREKS